MDRYEMTIKTEQLRKLVRNGDFFNAAKVADQIDWKKIKQWSCMSDAIDAYMTVGKYAEARNVLVYAYNRNLGGRRLLVQLTEVYIKLMDYDEAEDVYREFVELAPKDLTRFSLLYKLRKAQGAPTGELIDILQEYKENELDEAYEYELACLYSEAGMVDRCVKECDELVLWFADGVYVERALRLKRRYAKLTERQEKLLSRLEYISAKGIAFDSERLMAEDASNDEADAFFAFEDTEEEEPKEEDAASAITYEPALKDAEETISEDNASEDNVPEDNISEDNASEEAEETESSSENRPSLYSRWDRKRRRHEEADGGADIVSFDSLSRKDGVNDRKDGEIPVASKEKYDGSIDITNTTSWEPILEELDPEDEPLERDELPPSYAVAPAVSSAAFDAGEMKEIAPKAEEIKDSKSEDTKSEDSKPEDSEKDIADININIPDYSLYDTRNLQMELAASMKEIMAAGENRDAIEREKELEETESLGTNSSVQAEDESEHKYDTKPYPPLKDKISSDEPTKEIIINKHQWRKLERNGKSLYAPIVEPEDNLGKTQVIGDVASALTDMTNRTEETDRREDNIGAAVGQKAAEANSEVVATKIVYVPVSEMPEEPVDDQIEGQMDILEWLDMLEKEEQKEQKDSTESETDVPDIEEEFEDIPDVAEEAETVEEPADEAPEESVTEETVAGEPVAEELAAENIEESVVEETTVEEEATAEEVAAEEEPATEENAEEPAAEELAAEEEPATEENAEEPTVAEAVGQDTSRMPDLEDALNANIEKLVDEAKNEASVKKNAENYELSAEETIHLEQYLYMAGMEKKLARFIGSKRFAEDGYTKGNAVVCGNRSIDKYEFAVSLIKALHAFDDDRALKIAKASADGINAKGFERYAKKLDGVSLIIEDASRLLPENMESIAEYLKRAGNKALVILVDDEFDINRMLHEYVDFAGMFAGRFVLKPYSVNELVEAAKEYAEENDYKIDEKALLRLYLLLGEMDGSIPSKVIRDVYRMIDEAADRAKKHLGYRLIGKMKSIVTIKAGDLAIPDDEDEETEEDDGEESKE